MAVAFTQTANPAQVAPSGATVTYTAASIGTASADRIVCLLVGSTISSTSITSATCDSGGGAVAMSASTQGAFSTTTQARLFYLAVPTGTTATFVITFTGGSPATTTHQVSVYSVTGASATIASTGGNGSTDMDATAPLTTGSVTVNANGGFIGVVAGRVATSTKTWANATEDLDFNATGLSYSTATRPSSGTVTITCTGISNGEDGALSWLIFDVASSQSVVPVLMSQYRRRWDQ